MLYLNCLILYPNRRGNVRSKWRDNSLEAACRTRSSDQYLCRPVLVHNEAKLGFISPQKGLMVANEVIISLYHHTVSVHAHF